MWLWVGISVSDDFADLRNKCEIIAKRFDISDSCFKLEQHISLKMSFEVQEEFDNIVTDLTKIFKETKNFKIDISGIEMMPNIVLIKMKNNPEIGNLHVKICDLMRNKYNIKLHEYDLDFLFHSTLFMNEDSFKIEQAFDLIKDEKLPNQILASEFLIGYSETGNLGTYRVLKRIK